MAKLEFLVIHCTATPQGQEITSDTIRQWHLSPPPKGRGWKQVGYSDMIHLDGHIENLVSYDEDDTVDPWEITNGAAGVNSRARHIVYVGGLDGKHNPKDTRTEFQLLTLAWYVHLIIAHHPDIRIAGHNQFARKACPGFDVPSWLKEIGVSEHNIYIP